MIKVCSKMKIKLRKISNYLSIKKKLKRCNTQMVLYIGSPIYGNLGDQQIRNSAIEFLQSNRISYVEIGADIYYHVREVLKYFEHKIKAILIQGGGNFGDVYLDDEYLRDDVVRIFKNTKIILFPQTFYCEQKNNELAVIKAIFSNHPNLVIAARERVSYDAIKKEFPTAKIILVPDSVIMSDYSNKYKVKRNNRKVLFLTRHDREKTMPAKIFDEICNKLQHDGYNIEFTDTVVNYNVYDIWRDKELKRLFKKIMGAKFVITDRLHGMIFCAITNTPCIVFSNYNHKIKSTYYDWLKDVDYIDFIDDLEKFDLEKSILKICKSQKKWKTDYEKFKSLLKEIKNENN